MKQTRWILVAILVLAAVFALAACDEGVTPPVDEACEHAYESTVTAEPTCTKEGTTTYTCSKCQDSYTEAIAATGKHTYTETVTAPTCTAEGYTTYTCACGDTYRDNTVAATGHTYTDTVVAPTCSAEGYTTHTCACGDTYKDTTVAATGVHSYTEKVTAPTCTAEGYTTYTCACGKSYKDNAVAATGHDYTEKVTEEATCSKGGKATYTCSKCNDSYTAATAKKEHAYAAFTAHAPTCDTQGEEQTKCEICGDVYHTKVLEATGHSYTSSVTAPTCLADGYTTYTCSVCGHSYTEEIESAKGHDYVETVVAATCSTTGYTGYTCSVCGDTRKDNETDKDPNAHTYETKIVELSAEQAAANPLAIGVEKVVCAGCGAEGEGGAAVLIYLDFNELPADYATYEGSANYVTAMGTADDATSEQIKQIVTYLDSQKNLESWTKLSKNMSVEDGKWIMGTHPFYLFNTLKLAQSAPAVSTYTVSFDVIVNKDPASYTKKDRSPFFAMVDEKLYNNMNITLALDKVDVDTNTADEVYAYELYAQSYKDGPIKVDDATGYYMTLGVEYSIKMDVSAVDGVYVYHLYIKQASEAEYTDLGVHEYQPYGQNRACAFQFATSSGNAGNVFDNFKVTTELVK